MSDQDDSGADKTDHVSPKRERQAWEQGRIPLGKEMPGVVGAMAGVMVIMQLAPRLFASLRSLVSFCLSQGATAHPEELGRLLVKPMLQGLGVCAACAFAASATVLAQTRGHFWSQLAMPDFERLAGNSLKKLFSKQLFTELGMMALKTGIIGVVAALSVRDDLLTLPRLLASPPDEQLMAVFAPLGKLAVRILAVLAIFAGADLALTHFRFREKLKMTKEEAKRENKEEEGDPLLRMRRRKRARELAKGRVATEVPRADALLVNPTHVAVAIRYRLTEGGAPRVTAKGKGDAATMMRELARANGVPIIEDIALARLLFRKVKVGGRIPADTYKAVAAILAFVYRVTGRRPGAASILDDKEAR